MSSRGLSLDDKYQAETGDVLVTGIEALVRLPMDQIRRDRSGGLKTAGFISGYRGSPLGGYDQRLASAKSFLEQHDIHVQQGLNEDLAATAVFGSQQVNLHPGAKADGVFGIWYGKAPGVDRTGDVFKHANMAGTWHQGGVLAIAGDDPLGKSSSLPSQSEFAFIDAEIPILTPADIQDVLDFGLHGLALSRYSGLWVGMIALADLMDGSATINVDPKRLSIIRPDDDLGGPITMEGLQVPNRLQSEERLRGLRLPAVLRYARANGLNRVMADSQTPRIGLAVSGKSWSALLAALDLLGLSLRDAERLGLRLMKIGMPWPLEAVGMRAFAQGLQRVFVIEPKRALIETQLKEQFYGLPADRRPAILGKTDLDGQPLLSDIGDLDPLSIAKALIPQLSENDETAAMAERLVRIERDRKQAKLLASSSVRPPHFCSGCPHSRSTRLPEGSRAMAGIGCHIMTQWMGGEASGRGPAEGYSQMGGEGVAWLGQAPFTETPHVFANLGDGTYHHSGILAIRAAVAANARITYKILYNDAVAMTGGQSVDGPLSVEQIAAQMKAEGVQRIVVLSEEPDRFEEGAFADNVDVFDRSELLPVQKDLREFSGPSVLIFDQTCAAEKRRRRKRKLAPPPKQRVMINDRVCEGCGDCSRQSSCLSVEPIKTGFGDKRRINASSCNQDLSCLEGFCPSFVLVEGGAPQKPETPIEQIEAAAATLPLPASPNEDARANILLPGIGGTGVTTISAILAMAAHHDGLKVVSADMTGLAQKGGAVLSYLRFAPSEQVISGAKMLPGTADLVLACDPLVAAGAGCLELCSPGRTTVIADQSVAPTGSFALFQEQSPSSDDLAARLRRVAHAVHVLDAGGYAETLFGDRIFQNMMLVGAAFQIGALPLSLQSIEQAIKLNGVAAAKNMAAFQAGRVLAAAPDRLPRHENAEDIPFEESLDGLVGRLSAELEAYQNKALADRYRRQIAHVRLADRGVDEGPLALTEAVARNLFKLMAYKDEYEVARLYSAPAFREKLEQAFGKEAKASIQLSPPVLARIDPETGRPKKMTFGPWLFSLFGLLAKMKGLRGRWFDPFGWTEERRQERHLIERYDQLISRLLPSLSDQNYETAVALASLPEEIRGFGPVKADAIKAVEAKEETLLQSFDRSVIEGTVSIIEAPYQIAAE